MENNSKTSYLIVCAVYSLFLYIFYDFESLRCEVSLFFLLGTKWILNKKKHN